MLFQPSVWLEGIALRRAAESLTWLAPHQRRTFLMAPDAFVNADENQSDWLYETLERHYLEYIRKHSRSAARTRAVFETLSTSQIAYQFFMN